ncbi:MAG: glycogen/starch synthase [Bacteroidales bacterium]|nr:glycogen/starch synthase [Bacteroidales bacterium]HNS30066.1 glycogen/starch synthase [Tenuifilaceae bacterium]MBP8642978.1 glycogen/starch synthase [Bacteroidales bacterium]NLI87137.1 glycogen/starch synthase [Bacteroidales bacterium]HOA09990.1 glycogen/starch synthase [Tenuifilaceae bacterium]
MKSTKVLFISQEIMPYLPETQISKIGRYLPQGIQERGKEIRTFMPRFGLVNERRNQLHEVIRLSGMNLVIEDTDHPLIIKVASIQSARMQVYFIDNDDYFQRKYTTFDCDGKEFPDNDERAIFFCKGVLETVKKLRWTPDLVHCHGWITAFAPILIKKTYAEDPLFAKAKVIYSVYNDEFGTPLDLNVRKKILMEGITKKDVEILKEPSYVNLSKLAITHADAVIVGDRQINPELQEFINTVKKPILPYQNEENYIDVYSEFYDTILNSKTNVKKK